MTYDENPDKEEHLHYLKVLRDGYATFQPEVRFAIDFAIETLQKPNLYIENRKKLLNRLKTLILARESLNEEINRLRKELNGLDNMIM